VFICQNSEGVHPYLWKRCGGTCSFVGMLKGYIVRKRLGTPDLESDRTKATIDKTLIVFNLFRHKNSLLFY